MLLWLEGQHVTYQNTENHTLPPTYRENFTPEEIVASDWECEPARLEVTASILRGAVTNLGTKAMRPSDVVAHIITELEL